MDQLRRFKLQGTWKSCCCCSLHLISAISLLNLTLSCPIYQFSRNQTIKQAVFLEAHTQSHAPLLQPAER